MRPTDHARLLSQREEEIRSLETINSAHVARISILQARLLSALDTLDATRTSHAEECSALKHEVQLLKQQLRHHEDVANSAEVEMDDMRDAVLQLVQKVEGANDYKKLPRSSIRVSNFADMAPDAPQNHRKLTDEHDDLISYAASMIQNLCRERDEEKNAHAITRSAAEARIIALEAQLSRREAELELQIEKAGNKARPPTELHHPSYQRMSSAEIISILDDAVVRNKVLEVEIKSLLKRLEEARAASKANFWPKTSRFSNQPTDKSRDLINVSTSPLILPPSSTSRTSWAIHAPASFFPALEQEIHDLGDTIDAFRHERTVVKRTLSTPIDTNMNGEELPPRKMSHLHDIAVQTSNDIITRNNELEAECKRLRQTETSLCKQIEAMRTANQVREDELLNEISSMRAMLRGMQDETAAVPDLIDIDDGEMSMELATPLLSTNFFTEDSTAARPGPSRERENDSHQTRTQAGNYFIDPPSVPLPPSPTSTALSEEYDMMSNHGSDMMLAGQTSPRALSAHMAELQLVEMDLMDAQEHSLGTGDGTLDRLADLIDGWHS